MIKSKFFLSFFYFIKLDYAKRLNKHWYPEYETKLANTQQIKNYNLIIPFFSFILFKFSLPFLFLLSKIYEINLTLKEMFFIGKKKKIKGNKFSNITTVAIGNITVGGVGKTPLVISLIK